MKEKRETSRIGIAFPVEYTLLSEKKSFFCTASKDLSCSGIKILCEQPLAPGNKVKMDINLITEVITATAQIVWHNKMFNSARYYAGLKFLDMTDKHKRTLGDFLGQMAPS